MGFSNDFQAQAVIVDPPPVTPWRSPSYGPNHLHMRGAGPMLSYTCWCRMKEHHQFALYPQLPIYYGPFMKVITPFITIVVGAHLDPSCMQLQIEASLRLQISDWQHLRSPCSKLRWKKFEKNISKSKSLKDRGLLTPFGYEKSTLVTCYSLGFNHNFNMTKSYNPCETPQVWRRFAGFFGRKAVFVTHAGTAGWRCGVGLRCQ